MLFGRKLTYYETTLCIISEPPEINLPSADGFAEFDAVILEFIRDQGIPGASLCLAKDDKFIYKQSKWLR